MIVNYSVLHPSSAYALAHLAYHLDAGGRHAALVELLTRNDEWLEIKRRAFNNDVAYRSDLDLASRRLKDPLYTVDEVLALVRLSAARQVVHAEIADHSDDHLAVLAWMDQVKPALGSAFLRQDPEKVCDGLLVIYRVLRMKGAPDENLLNAVRAYLDEVQTERGRVYVACALAIEYHQKGESRLAAEYLYRAVVTLGRMEKTRYETIWARQVAGVASARIESLRAGLSTVDEIGDPFWKALGFIEILRYLPELAYQGGGRALETCRRLIRNSDGAVQQIYASRYLVKALLSAGEHEKAIEVFSDITGFNEQRSANPASDPADSWYAVCCIDLGNLEGAPHVLAKRATHGEHVRELVDALARQGAYRDVEAALTLTDDEEGYRYILRRLVISAAEYGQSWRAREYFNRYQERSRGNHRGRRYSLHQLSALTVKTLQRLRESDPASRFETGSESAPASRRSEPTVHEDLFCTDAEIDTALTLLELGDCDRARAELEKLDEASLPLETTEQMKFRLRLGAAFGRAGLRSRAVDILQELQDFQKWWRSDTVNREDRTRTFSDAMAEAGAFAMALETLAIQVDSTGLEAYYSRLAQWAPHFERVVPRSGLSALKETANIFGWVCPEFRRLAEIFESGQL